jgi:plasmid stability protein
MTANIQIPDNLMQRLQARAKREGVAPDSEAADILREALAQDEPVVTERELVLRVLRESGKLVELSPELQKRIIPGVTHEEVRESFARAGGQPLSEIAIEQRGPKDWETSQQKGLSEV